MAANTKYCHYTTQDNARNILCDGSILLSKFESMNDQMEYEHHKNDQNKVFSACFCHSEAFNIPLFYLYGGIDGKGCRVQFSKARLNEIIKNGHIYYVNKSKKTIKKAIDPSKYHIYMDYIYYVTSNGYCKHEGEEKEYGSLENFLQVMGEKRFFVKNPIWKFEKEYRIIVVFDEDIKYDKIALCFPTKANDAGISVVVGPEMSNEEYEAFQSEIQDYGIRKCKKVSETNRVKMGLVEKNRRLLRNEKTD